jgi:hypothetical protein
MKILSVKLVDGKLEIRIKFTEDHTDHDGEIMPGTITWWYTPPHKWYKERLESDMILESPIGDLVTGLLSVAKNLDDDSASAVRVMEEMLA